MNGREAGPLHTSGHPPQPAPHGPPPVVCRPAEPADRAAIEALDDSFRTDRVYEVLAGPDGFTLRETPVDPPLLKVFPDEGDDGEAPFEGLRVEVAVDGPGGEAVRGYVAFRVEEWNRRLVVDTIAVAPAHRGAGVGQALMERACAYGRSRGARTAWLEVTNVNAPAVRAYRRMGFELCGLDTTLYRGTASEGETALFMSKPL
ncbi:GNAT family N-acetyltransferase [Streptomyces sp. NPDC048659]|uniref:GNAT family N-acetyltransferase n=1 Tax=Streptomyces sp. NPDC048659 TaxID=3155489 RepID=UPI0034374C66